MSTKHRTARSHRPAVRTAPTLHGQRELSALAGLAYPTPLTRDELALLPNECVIPPDEVARTHAGVTRVLAGIGHADLSRCEIATGLQAAAERGIGLSVPPHMAKALWRFCDAFVPREPLLHGAREGLRVHQV